MAGRPSDYEIEDATEFHFGGEVNVSGGDIPVFLRGGVFNNPDHRARFVGSPFDRRLSDQIFFGDESVGEVNFAAFNLQEQKVRWGWTAGFGLAIKRIQVDGALVSIDAFDEAVISIAYRF